MKFHQSLTIVFIVFSSITISAQIDINSAVQINEHTGFGKSQKTYLKGAANKRGHKALLWLDTRDGFNQLYAQFLDSANNQLGSNFKVNENFSTINTFSYDAAVNESNEFLIAWTEENSLYYRFFDKDGKAKPAIMTVEAEENVYGYEKPAISFLPDGSFVMVMMNDPHYDGPLDGIYIQKFNAAGKPATDKILIDEIDGYTPYKSSDVSVSSDKIIVVYEKSVKFNSDVFYSIFDFSLNVKKETAIINSVEEKKQINPAVATFSDNRFIVSWIDFRNGFHGDVYYQNYNSDGEPIDTNRYFEAKKTGNFTSANYPFMQINEKDEVFFSISTHRNKWSILDKELSVLESNEYTWYSGVPFVYGNDFDLAYSKQLYYTNDDILIQDIKDDSPAIQINDDQFSSDE